MTDAVTQLVERFKTIGDERMKDLPFYNHAMEVEAIGFSETDKHHIGVLITPWFINFMMLFKQQPEKKASLGERVQHELPSGEHSFMVGEDDELGRYDFISLISPTLKIKTQQEARAKAVTELEKYMSPPDENGKMVDVQAVQFVSREEPPMNRRAFLRGEYSGKS